MIRTGGTNGFVIPHTKRALVQSVCGDDIGQNQVSQEDMGMLNREAEASFERGHRALEKNDWKEATAFFEAAVTLERKLCPHSPQARYRSFYGLCVGLAKKRHFDAIRLCRSAITLERYNPDLHLNLGRVFFDAGRKREAHRAFVQGLRQETGHMELIRAVKRMGLRKRPVLRFLRRTHPLNVALGRMRAQNRARAKSRVS